MPAPEPTATWWSVVGPAIGVTFAAGLAWLKFYFESRSEEKATPRGEIASKAIGAAFVDRSVADVVVGMATDVKSMAGDVKALLNIAQKRDKHEEQDEIAQRIRDDILRDLNKHKRGE